MTSTPTSISWLVNPSYKINENVLAYFSVAHGEKSGAVQFDDNTGQPQNVDPEKVMDYEIGLKTSLFNNTLIFNPNLYWTEVQDYQAQLSEQQSDGTIKSYLGNVGKLRLAGIEIEGSWLPPIEGLRINFSGAYNNAIYASFKDAPCPLETSNVAVPICDLSGEADQRRSQIHRQHWLRLYEATGQWIGRIPVRQPDL